MKSEYSSLQYRVSFNILLFIFKSEEIKNIIVYYYGYTLNFCIKSLCVLDITTKFLRSFLFFLLKYSLQLLFDTNTISKTSFIDYWKYIAVSTDYTSNSHTVYNFIRVNRAFSRFSIHMTV